MMKSGKTRTIIILVEVTYTFLQPGPAAPAAAEGRDDDLLLNVCLQQQSETNFTSINHVECHNSSDWLDDFSSST